MTPPVVTKMMTSTTGSSKEKGFTLLEILVVVALISLLTSIMTSTIRMVRMKAVEGEAKNRIARLETALELYKLNIRFYPTATTNQELVNVLTTDPQDGSNWQGPYMKFRTGELSGGKFIDPWGEAYSYYNDTTDNYVEIKSNSHDDVESKRYY